MFGRPTSAQQDFPLEPLEARMTDMAGPQACLRLFAIWTHSRSHVCWLAPIISELSF